MTTQNSRAERKRGKPRGKPFKKGVSGNPGGRPKEEREVVEALRLHGMEAVEALRKLIRAKRPNVKAIEVLFDRAYGKAKQIVELGGSKDGAPLRFDLSQLTDEELDAVERIRNRLDSR